MVLPGGWSFYCSMRYSAAHPWVALFRDGEVHRLVIFLMTLFLVILLLGCSEPNAASFFSLHLVASSLIQNRCNENPTRCMLWNTITLPCCSLWTIPWHDGDEPLFTIFLGLFGSPCKIEGGGEGVSVWIIKNDTIEGGGCSTGTIGIGWRGAEEEEEGDDSHKILDVGRS